MDVNGYNNTRDALYYRNDARLRMRRSVTAAGGGEAETVHEAEVDVGWKNWSNSLSLTETPYQRTHT